MVNTLIEALFLLLELIRYLIIIRCLLSWLPINRGNVVIRLIYNLTEPILYPIRKLINNSPIGRGGMFIDFSPVIAILLIEVIIRALFRLF